MPFAERTGPLAAQEHIQDLIRNDAANIELIINVPQGCSEDIWVYEHTKQFVLETSLLVTELQKTCTKATCPQMDLRDSHYHCTVHPELRECCAIDYMCHNLDNATDLLLNMNIGFQVGKMSESEKSITSQILRRLYRMLAHAKQLHEGVFREFEKEMYLYKRYYHFCRLFNINQKEKPMQPSS